MRGIHKLLYCYIGISLIGLGIFFSLREPMVPAAQQLRPVPTLSQQQYERLKDRYVSLVKTKSPDIAINTVRQEAENDYRIMRYCHEFMHEVGKESLRATGDFAEAARYQDAICTSGYIHGVLQEYFMTTDNMFVAMKTVCSSHTKQDFFAWECYHGVGHGLMYFSGNNLPLSVLRCDSYTSDFERLACTNGVYMENFNADEENHPTKYRKPNDTQYPCVSQPSKYKSGCYQTLPIYYLLLHLDEYAQALLWCDGVEKDFRRFCYEGVGDQATRRNISKVKFVEKMCMGGKSEQRKWCVVGLVNYYISHYGSIENPQHLCGQLENENKATCKEIYQLVAGMF